MRNIALWHGDESTYVKYDSSSEGRMQCAILAGGEYPPNKFCEGDFSRREKMDFDGVH